ncbi:WXG100 family type VII secretion target [Kitasatospora terrestris]|uniref:Outer membrane channel protein CpnT-like N-terminal domain-containing protein n=1 Tax=Kitasatospora terrestris TaxID=258051 RepID=A0ABP9E7G7_9ACTN
MSIIGINWPTVNEDKVREFASHVREFGQAVEAAHQKSTSMVEQLGQAYEGASYEALLAKWASVSDQHFNQLVQACHVVADALDIAADVIVAMKVETIAELVALAAAFIADQAAEAALGVDGGAPAGTGFRIDPDGLERHAQLMHDQAETVAGHAQVFQSKIAGVSFE